jgi:two-component system chemotaxis sensor kinase CheA
MNLDLKQFQATFYEESFEGLDIFESNLLNLDIGQADQEVVNKIFRAAHSIKGGSATFGLTDVASFTHVMETILDEIRAGSRQVTREAVDLLLESGDCLREMLTACQDEQEPDRDRIASVQSQLEALMNSGKEAEGAGAAKGEKTVDESGSWSIGFRPFPDMLLHGNDPLHMIRELGEKGELEVRLIDEKLPSFADLDPEACYFDWKMTLKGEISREEVDAVFEWVDDECDLKISNDAPDSVIALFRRDHREGRNSSAGQGSSTRPQVQEIRSDDSHRGELQAFNSRTYVQDNRPNHRDRRVYRWYGGDQGRP